MKKKYLQAAFLFILTCLICYLAGAFTAASFDVSTWHPGGRGMVALCSVLFGAMFASFTIEP